MQNCCRYEYVANDGPSFVLKTNRDAPKYRLVRVELDQPDQSNWTDLIPESEHVLQWAACSSGHALLVCHLVHVKDVLTQYNLSDGQLVRQVQLPGVGTVSSVYAEREQREVFLGFTSFVDPGSCWSYNTDDGSMSMWHQNHVEGLDVSSFTVEQVFVPSKDGTVQIPMFIVMPKNGVPKNGQNVALMYAYGGFNISLTPSFNPVKLALTQMHGGIYCVANLRGGGEYGEEWHK